MNIQLLRLMRFFALSWSAVLGAALLVFALPGSRGQESQQSEEDRCYPWQYRDDHGDCVDRPHVIHFHGEHHPSEAGEQCWIECLCEEGTYPSGNDCGACSFVGTVCIRN
jgi:hypothetical protein